MQTDRLEKEEAGQGRFLWAWLAQKHPPIEQDDVSYTSTITKWQLDVMDF
jgi:hypothetical protein